MRMPSKQLLIPGLGYLGVIPFAACAFLVLRDSSELVTDPAFLFVGYSVVILAFLGGTLWGSSRALEDSSRTSGLLLASNIIALLGWGSLIAFQSWFTAALIVLILGYASVLVIERRNALTLGIDTGDRYLVLRSSLTALVILLHILVLLAER
jgi:hypothetical protein